MGGLAGGRWPVDRVVVAGIRACLSCVLACVFRRSESTHLGMDYAVTCLPSRPPARPRACVPACLRASCLCVFVLSPGLSVSASISFFVAVSLSLVSFLLVCLPAWLLPVYLSVRGA